MAESHQGFGVLPDCAPVVEGRVTVISRTRLRDGGWLAVYKFTKQTADGRTTESVRHYAMWQGENGSCRFKVYETAVPAELQTAEGSYIASPAKSPLPYDGRVFDLERSPMVLSDSTPGSLIGFAKHSPLQFVPDSQTKESTTCRALVQ